MMNETVKTTDKPGVIENVTVGGQSSRLSSIIFFLLCIVPVFTTILFGGVDNVTWIVVTICWVAIIVMWLIEAWRAKGLIFESSYLQLPLIGILLIGLIQLLPLGPGAGDASITVPATNLLTLDPNGTRYFLSHLIVYIVFFAACLTFINSEKRLRKVVFLVVIFGAIMAFVAILQRLASPDMIYGLRNPGQAVPFGPFINQHHFASFMEMTGGLTLGLIFGKSGLQDKKPLLFISVAIMTIAVILTSSRGGMIASIAVLAFVLAMSFIARKRNRTSERTEERTPTQKALIATVAAAAVLVLIGSVVFLGGSDALLRGVTMDVGKDDMSNGRLHFWSVAIKIFLDHPILGAGLDAFGVAFTKHDTWHGIFRVEQAHNEYLQILAETGIVGFACIGAFIYLLFKRGMATIASAGSGFRQNVAIGALAGCFGILIHSLFDFPLRTPSNGFFFLLLVAIATVSVKTAGDGDSHRRKKRRSTSHSQ
ncbi:MAG: O-antigen ligase family protein [Pyrinomonadaceae bacterium]|nr:O-antigen ligase family protein [Pyrinomonadaceae bacterium]